MKEKREWIVRINEDNTGKTYLGERSVCDPEA